MARYRVANVENPHEMALAAADTCRRVGEARKYWTIQRGAKWSRTPIERVCIVDDKDHVVVNADMCRNDCDGHANRLRFVLANNNARKYQANMCSTDLIGADTYDGACRKAALRYHPDKYACDKDGDLMKEINVACGKIKDMGLRPEDNKEARPADECAKLIGALDAIVVKVEGGQSYDAVTQAEFKKAFDEALILPECGAPAKALNYRLVRVLMKRAKEEEAQPKREEAQRPEKYGPPQYEPQHRQYGAPQPQAQNNDKCIKLIRTLDAIVVKVEGGQSYDAVTEAEFKKAFDAAMQLPECKGPANALNYRLVRALMKRAKEEAAQPKREEAQRPDYEAPPHQHRQYGAPPKDIPPQYEPQRQQPQYRQYGQYEPQRQQPQYRQYGQYEQQRPQPRDRQDGQYEQQRPQPQHRQYGQNKPQRPQSQHREYGQAIPTGYGPNQYGYISPQYKRQDEYARDNARDNRPRPWRDAPAKKDADPYRKMMREADARNKSIDRAKAGRRNQYGGGIELSTEHVLLAATIVVMAFMG
jgi:hypothetical protein